MEENVSKAPRRKRRVVLGMDGSKNADEALKYAALMTRIADEEQHVTKLRLAQFQELMKQHGIQGTVKQIGGEPGPQLVEAAVKEGADCIITGSRGLGTLRRTFMGSVSDYVVHHSSVPVVVCRLKDSLH